MRVWILEIGEPLPLEPDVRLHRYGLFSKYLAEQGADVTWWTSSFSHAPKQHFVEKDEVRKIAGVRLKFIRGPGYQRNVSLARIAHNKHFAQRFKQLAPLEQRPDLILAPIPIIETAFEAAQFAKRQNVKILTDIRDLWPQELVERAPRPLRPLAKLLLFRAYHKMRHLCHNVDGVLGICQSYLNYGLNFAERPQSSNDAIFYLGYSPSPAPADKLQEARAWRNQLGLGRAKLNICFFGTIGEFFDLDTVIAAARDLEGKFDIQWIICGNGSRKEHYQNKAQGLNSVLFPGWVKHPQIQAIMEVCQVGLAPYRKDAHMALPNKPFEYMSGKLAVISSIRTELPELLQKHNCGLTYTADSVSSLKECVLRLYENPELCQRMGENGYRLWSNDFTTERVFANAWQHMQNVVSNK